jgi:hypothetical protein
MASPRRVVLLASVLAAAAAASILAGGSAASADPMKDPATIACPTPPAGWDALPPKKSLATPQSVPEPDAEEHFATGGNLVSVTCTYYASTNTHVDVTVSYALPSDANPINDFYWGCGTGTLKWNASDRVYRVPSVSQWANATLVDMLGYLPDRDLAAFENVTNALLRNANGYGHACDTKFRPTALDLRYAFDFRAAGANLKNVFVTEQPQGGGTAPIVKSTVTTAKLQVPTKTGKRAMTIKLAKGIDYRPATKKASGRVRFQVQVVNSRVSSCRRGANGTLTITTKPSVLLTVCGQSFLRGADVNRVRIYAF